MNSDMNSCYEIIYEIRGTKVREVLLFKNRLLISAYLFKLKVAFESHRLAAARSHSPLPGHPPGPESIEAARPSQLGPAWRWLDGPFERKGGKYIQPPKF